MKTAPALVRRRWTVFGRVQGVGFRPFLFRLARRLELRGRIYNAGGAAVIEAEGPAAVMDRVGELIRTEAPPGARVDLIEVVPAEARAFDGLQVLPSAGGPDPRTPSAPSTELAPDLAPCPACLREIRDPTARRCAYPFTSCTECGPRYTILTRAPYDRERTSMRVFALCDECKREYEDPEDRRFHHEANCCPACGPRLRLLKARTAGGGDADAAAGAQSGPGSLRDRHAADPIAAAVAALRDGRILALKGVGGYQLLADPRRPDTLRRLRTAKGRARKPFALMVPELAAARALVSLSPEEEVVLTAPLAPILIAERRAGVDSAIDFDLIAPGSFLLGVMLPASPLHQLLAWQAGPLVCTSGNREGEPIAVEEDQAFSALDGIADLFLVHDRAILRQADDSVVRVMNGAQVVLRRGRGFAPAPLFAPIPPGSLEASPESAEFAASAAAGVLAFGAHQKNAPALVTASGLRPGLHIGDLDTLLARERSARATADLVSLSGGEIEAVACDLHPDYASTELAERFAGERGIQPPLRVQHHLAHVLAVLGEHGLVPGPDTRESLLGIAWDGTGYGSDGTIWGAEFLLIKELSARRSASLRPLKLPGGEAAIRDPSRVLYAMLLEIGAESSARVPAIERRSSDERSLLRTMIERGLNVPSSSGMGRLFDAFAVLLGLIDTVDFDGEAALALELAALRELREPTIPDRAAVAALPFGRDVDDPVCARLDWRPALKRALELRAAGARAGVIALAFHRGLARTIRDEARRVGLRRVVLAGGCFQNKILLEESVALLEDDGRTVLYPRELPPGDGGLAAGQALGAATGLTGVAIGTNS